MKNTIHIPVFFEGQDDLIDILATSMVSICYNTKSFIDFYILDCGICDFNKKLLEKGLKEKFSNFSIEFIPVDLKQFEGLKGWGAGNFLDCYARLLIPEVKPKLDKVIYLDSDVVAFDDIKKLYEESLDGYTYGAVPDLGYCGVFFENCTQKLGLPKTHVYPNAGVLLLDTKEMRKIKFTKNILALARKEKENIFVINEDLFSVFFGCNQYKRLPQRYNLTDRTNEIQKVCAPDITTEYLKEEWNHIVIQHLSPGKAWKIIKSQTGKDLKNFSAFWFFAQMTPFHDGMTKKFLESITSIIVQNHIINAIVNMNANANIKSMFKIELFSFIPFLKIKKSSLYTKYYLFNLFQILRINHKNQSDKWKLFGFIPLFKIIRR